MPQLSIPRHVFFFHDTAPTEIYTLSLHDALPISGDRAGAVAAARASVVFALVVGLAVVARSEEHTSELQSRRDLVCRLLLEKKKIRDISAAVVKVVRRHTRTHPLGTSGAVRGHIG